MAEVPSVAYCDGDQRVGPSIFASCDKDQQGDCEFTRKVSNPPRFEASMQLDEHKEEGGRPKSYKDSLLTKSKGRDNWFAISEEEGSIGKVLELDVHTTSRGRNKFARVCIELDLTKSLVPHYMVNGILKHVEYESLHALWLNCRLFGHFKESCVHGKKEHNMGKKRRDQLVNEDVKISLRYDVLNEENEQVQDGIATGRESMMEDNNGKYFIKRRDKGPRKPVSISEVAGPLSDVKNIPKGSQKKSDKGERSKQRGNMGVEEDILSVSGMERRGEENMQGVSTNKGDLVCSIGMVWLR
ncbi:hypothetical protein K1719_002691 [Acacia pycnantha]|nr:hypothetical protein K1719_002691 [Acacia pycnantha]